MPEEKPVVRPEDYLGRSVSEQKRAKYAKRNNKLQSRALHPKTGKNEISVDKLNRSQAGDCAYDNSHVRVAEKRPGTFYGWGYFTREVVETETPCTVHPDGFDCNPNHVLIKFPEVVKTCNKKRNEIAALLANLSRWLEHLDPMV